MSDYTNLYRGIIAALIALALTACAATETRRSTGQVVDDASIASRVKTALIADKETDGRDIEIEIDRGRVQLNGYANSDAEKARAEEIALGIDGVTSVDNNLGVVEGDRTVGEYIDDKVLLARVNGALAKESDVSALDIEVEVNRGEIQLSGYVDTAKERAAASAAAKRVDGVNNVVNSISVRR